MTRRKAAVRAAVLFLGSLAVAAGEETKTSDATCRLRVEGMT